MLKNKSKEVCQGVIAIRFGATTREGPQRRSGKNT
jgi:hypothetical protein